MESYRSGHNELHSKCSCPLQGTWVRIPHSPPENSVHKRVCHLWAFFILPLFRGVYPQFSPNNCSFLCKNAFIRTLPYVEGIGLVERKKQGREHPARIYVKNFILEPEPSAPVQTAEKQQARPLD